MSADGLKPIAAAFEEAEAQRRAAEAAAEEQAQRAKDAEEDRKSVLRVFRKEGLAKAKRIGKLYGLTAQEVEAICHPPQPEGPRPSAGGDDGGPPPAAPRDPDAPEPPRRKKNPVKPLPGTCPVIPLGSSAGVFWYLNPNKEIRPLTKHGADDIRGLFAERTRTGENPRGIDWLWENFAKFNKNGEHTGFDIAHAAESLMTAAAARGVFDPARMLRGLGAWTDANGGLVLHCGNAIWLDGQWCEPGILAGMVYPGDVPAPRPTETPADGTAAATLLALYDRWPWQWGADADTNDSLYEIIKAGPVSPAAYMMLGWTGCALVGGALDWRPMVWVTGDAGGGKSTLQKVVQGVFGEGLVASSDATSAGIYQTIGYSSRAVAIDEAEADPFSPKMKNMVELVRQSASGGLILRGSNDAKVRGFTARSAFLLSSIIIPSLNAQDLTRLAILRLGKLADVAPPKIDSTALRQIGRALRRRILDQWGAWPARLEAWRDTLREVGHDARGQDQFGALFAMADTLLSDEVADRDTRYYIAATTRHLVEERRGSSNADTMLQWLLSVNIDNVFRGGQQYTVRTIIRCACGFEDLDGGSAGTCQRLLQERGIFVDISDGAKERARIWIANQHKGLADLFKNTIWSTAPGAAQSGWQQAVARLEGATAMKKYGVRGWSVPAPVILMGDTEKRI